MMKHEFKLQWGLPLTGGVAHEMALRPLTIGGEPIELRHARGDAEVHHARAAVAAHEDVRWLQVAMHNQLPVCGIDRNTDNLMQQEAERSKPDCSVMDVKQSGSKVTIHTVCKIEGTTATTDGVFEGSFDTAYKGTMKTRFNPPMHGMSESNMTQEARWIGPCKPGQKPGDVVMPNMGGMDMNKMMNDPKFKEMMQQYEDEE